MATLETAFARFCKTGDPKDLGAVFDGTAAELFRVATHLVGDPHRAEDLLQTTFLVAIEKRHGFRGRGSILAWLLAILTNRVRESRREDGRRPDAERLARPPDHGPRATAEAAELTRAVSDAIGKLPSPYQPVLNLHLAHGLAAHEIALALMRPPGTVRTQLVRGMELLRKALPRGLAVGAVVGLMPTRGLAAIRESVLRSAGRIALPTAGVLAGVFAMKKLLGGVGLICVALAGWLYLGQEEPLSSSLVELAASGDALVADLPTGSPKPEERELVGVAAARQPVDLGVTFVGRAVSAESGLPLAGATVEAVLRTRWDNQSPVEAQPPAVTTGPDGRYELRVFPYNPELRLHVYVYAPGRASMFASFSQPLRRGVTVDNGDVPMALGAELRLRVLDENAAPVLGFEIQLRRPAERPQSADGMFRDLGWGGMRETDARGIAGPFSVIAGTWGVDHAEGTGHRYQGPPTVRIPRGRTEVSVNLPVRSPEPESSIAGVIVDELGVPIEGIEIWATQALMGGYRVEKSFAGGQFHLPGLPPERGPVTVSHVRADGTSLLSVGKFEYELLEPRHPVEPGTRDLRIVARRRPVADAGFRIVDQRRLPVEDFRFREIPVLHHDSGTRVLGRRGALRLGAQAHHPGGFVQLNDLPTIDHLLVVVPENPGLQPVLFHEFLPSGDGDPVEIVLQPGVFWKVRVTDSEGKPVEGSTVEFLRGVGRTRVDDKAYAAPWDDVFEHGILSTNPAIAIATAQTNEVGLATLRTSSSVDGCALRVIGPLHAEAFVELHGTVNGGEVHQLAVEPASRIVAQLGPPELLASLVPSQEARAAAAIYADPEPSLVRNYARLRQRLPGGFTGDYDEQVVIPDDGRIAFDSVPPGDYVLSGRLPGSVDLGEVRDLRSGEERSMEIDLRTRWPGTFSGQVFLDGKPPPEFSSLRLYGNGRPIPSVPLNPDGRFEARLNPTELAIELVAGGDVGIPVTVDVFRHADTVVIEAGRTHEVKLEFVRRRVDLRVVDRDGEPVTEKWIRLHTIDDQGQPGRRIAGMILDANGEASLESSWHEPLVVVLWIDPPHLGPFVSDEPRGRHVVLGRVEVPSGQVTAKYVLTVDL